VLPVDVCVCCKTVLPAAADTGCCGGCRLSLLAVVIWHNSRGSGKGGGSGVLVRICVQKISLFCCWLLWLQAGEDGEKLFDGDPGAELIGCVGVRVSESVGVWGGDCGVAGFASSFTFLLFSYPHIIQLIKQTAVENKASAAGAIGAPVASPPLVSCW